MNVDGLTSEELGEQLFPMLGVSTDELASLPDGVFRTIRVGVESPSFVFGAEVEITAFYGREGYIGSAVTVSAIAEYGTIGEPDYTFSRGLAFGDSLNDFGGVALARLSPTMAPDGRFG